MQGKSFVITMKIYVINVKLKFFIYPMNGFLINDSSWVVNIILKMICNTDVISRHFIFDYLS